MTLYPEQPVSKRLDTAKGKFHDPEDFDVCDDEIAAMRMESDR